MKSAPCSKTVLPLVLMTMIGLPCLTANAQTARTGQAGDSFVDEILDSDLNHEFDTSLELDFAATLLTALQDEPPAEAGARDQTGTDPRDFSSKLMPYYRYVSLENEIKAQLLTVFGMHAFTPKFAMTYEIPLVKSLDYSEFAPFIDGTGGFPPGGGGFNDLPGGGTSFDDLEADGDVIGVGDLILRFFAASDDWGGQLDDENSWSIIPVVEMTLPTATNDVIGGNAWILSPGITLVTDLPGGPPFGLGFVAFMNFFDFDVVKSLDRADTLRYRGRWFWMQPLSKPGPNLFDGLYILTELQPVYDFENDDFDLWIGPEFGKIVNPELTIYGKPGWGIDNESSDREFTFEVGFRWFF